MLVLVLVLAVPPPLLLLLLVFLHPRRLLRCWEWLRRTEMEDCLQPSTAAAMQ